MNIVNRIFKNGNRDHAFYEDTISDDKNFSDAFTPKNSLSSNLSSQLSSTASSSKLELFNSSLKSSNNSSPTINEESSIVKEGSKSAPHSFISRKDENFNVKTKYLSYKWLFASTRESSTSAHDKSICKYKGVMIQAPKEKKFAPSRPYTKTGKYYDPSIKLILECHQTAANHLDLSSLGLFILPESLGLLTHLNSLSVYENKLQVLPASLGALSRLELLLAQCNSLVGVPPQIAQCRHLSQIDLRHNRLEGSSLPAGLQSLPGLRQLFLSFNRLSGLDGVQHLHSLQVLVVKENQLAGRLTAHIGQLAGLTSLDVSHNRLVELPEEIGGCAELLRLSVEFNKLKALPESLGRLSKLTKLGIKYNQIDVLPASLLSCSQLTELNVENNRLCNLPDNLLSRMSKTHSVTLSRNRFHAFPTGGPQQFTFTKKLFMDHNELDCIPLGIFSCAQNLQQLSLRQNSIVTIIPSDLRSWSMLTELYLGWNCLSILPDEIGCLSELVVLELTSNNLKKLPDSLTQLTKLTSLDLEFNQIRQLPEDLGALTQLRTLVVNSNLLETLPRSIRYLAELRQLKLNENCLVFIPPEIGCCVQLEEIYLNDNPSLHSLPVELIQLGRLNFLGIENCPLSEIPGDIVARGPSLILRYLQYVNHLWRTSGQAREVETRGVVDQVVSSIHGTSSREEYAAAVSLASKGDLAPRRLGTLLVLGGSLSDRPDNPLPPTTL